MKSIIYLICVFSFISYSQIDKKQSIVNNTVFDTVILGGRVMNPETRLDTTEKVGSDTLLSQIIQMVNDASRSRAPIQNLADITHCKKMPKLQIKLPN